MNERGKTKMSIKKFYVRRWNMSKNDNLVVAYCTREQLLLAMAFGAVLYAETAEGVIVTP
jgi:hypothetical protein